MAEKYYKGNNIGLTFDGTGWKLNNLPQNFINPEAFSTKDPVFPKVPTTPPTTEPEEDPCPPGYIFDKVLNQCVPDPNYQNPFRQDNQSGGQDDNTGTGLAPFNQAPQYKAGATGGESLVPTEDSGIDYNIFNYGTYAPTRAQMNEFMLINYGLDKGWLSYDDEKDAYRKIQFQEQIDPTARKIVDNQWALNLLQMDAYRNYKDYFEILEKGWQPSSNQNVWKKWIQGDTKYSLTGGMTFKEMSTRGGRGSDVTYINFSDDFKKKINQAMSIKDSQGNVKGIIDREGNVNVRGDAQGGYYNSEGRYINADGSAGGANLLQGMQYLINLKNSGIKLPENLKKRLFKGINSKALTSEIKSNLANQLGYSSWNDAKKELDTAVSDDNWWKKDDDGIIKIDDASSATDVNIDNINEDGTTQVQDDKDSGYSNYEQDTVSTGSGSSGSGFSYGTGSSEEYDKFNGSSSSSSSSGSSSSSTRQSANQGPAGGPPPSPPSSAGEAFKRYGRF